MVYLLQLFQQNRKNIISLLQEHSLAQINAVPKGLNNNLIWNAGHLLLSQQFFMYYLTGASPLIPMKVFMPKYAGGTVPQGNVTQEEFDQMIDLLQITSEKAVEDYNKGLLSSFKGYTSDYFNQSLNNIEEAIHFNTYHEGFHLGCMSKIKQALK